MSIPQSQSDKNILELKNLKFVGNEQEQVDFKFALEALIKMVKEKPELGSLLNTLINKEPPITIKKGMEEKISIAMDGNRKKTLIYSYADSSVNMQESPEHIQSSDTPGPRRPSGERVGEEAAPPETRELSGEGGREGATLPETRESSGEGGREGATLPETRESSGEGGREETLPPETRNASGEPTRGGLDAPSQDAPSSRENVISMMKIIVKAAQGKEHALGRPQRASSPMTH
jgi:hypothetical protein